MRVGVNLGMPISWRKDSLAILICCLVGRIVAMLSRWRMVLINPEIFFQGCCTQMCSFPITVSAGLKARYLYVLLWVRSRFDLTLSVWPGLTTSAAIPVMCSLCACPYQGALVCLLLVLLFVCVYMDTGCKLWEPTKNVHFVTGSTTACIYTM